MKLIIIYGPPASGKLTIAHKVAERTGYKLFHNHLTVDLLKNILKFGTKEFFEVNQKIKLDILEAAAKQGVDGIIYTFVYDSTTDKPFIGKLKEIAKKQNISLKFLQVYCEKEELFKRVIAESRKQYKKVQSVEGLSRYLESGDFLSPVDIVDSIKVDNTNLSVAETVELVLQSI